MTAEVCTKREHVVPYHFQTDHRMYRCECGALLIGHGKATIRFSLLYDRFPAIAEIVTRAAVVPCPRDA